MKLNDKTILITGASSGIGKALALELSKYANRIIITARREALLNELKAEVEAKGSSCLALAADSTDEEQVKGLIDKAIETYGTIDIAVLNAGGGQPNSMGKIDTATLKSIIAMNVDTVTNYLAHLIQHMKERDAGTIAYTSSPAGYYGLPNSGPYCAAKAAGRVLFESCRIDMASSNIKFTSIYPGFCYTGTFTEKDRVDNGIPKFMVIQQDRAVKEFIKALEQGKENHFFPKRLKIVHSFGRILPEPIRRRVLA